MLMVLFDFGTTCSLILEWYLLVVAEAKGAFAMPVAAWKGPSAMVVKSASFYVGTSSFKYC